MRAFLAACVVAIILAVGGVLALGAAQIPSGVAFSTDGVRIDPSWSWRQIFRRSASNPPASPGTPGPDVSGALVSFFSLDSSGHSVLLGSALTDAKGVYSIVLPDVQQPGTAP